MARPFPTALWSAAPTPLTEHLAVDLPSVARMIEQAVADGLHGVFLAGTCGEGMCLPNRERRRLIEVAARTAQGRLQIAAQVSDNSAARILENVEDVAAAGANFAIIAPPYALLNDTPERITALFEEAVQASPLPVGIYDLGAQRAFAIPASGLKRIYLLPNVRFVKDSSADPARRELALAARREKPELRLYNGDEFRFLEYLEAGYDGCMFGGAVAVAAHLRRGVELFAGGRRREAAEVERRMQDKLYGLYGGRDFACWLAGLKHYLVCQGQFTSAASHFGYPLTDECRAFAERAAAAPDFLD
ncbi:MAG: dihydrodipicolinate synthase family protein [Opitutaceae bacterium]|nr:dihydrodipicolinate synthase family protein [Opitutaceae bacterium]